MQSVKYSKWSQVCGHQTILKKGSQIFISLTQSYRGHIIKHRGFDAQVPCGSVVKVSGFQKGDLSSVV